MKKKGILTASLVVLCSLGSAFGAVALYSHMQNDSAAQPTQLSEEVANAAQIFNQPARATNTMYQPGSVPDNFVKAAAAAIDGVVHIRSEKVVQTRQPRFFDPFEFFFGRPSMPQGQPGEQPKAIGIGSGVIISTDGYIITNNHVIADTDKLYVTTNDNEEYEATVIGSDPMTDIALIKINATGLRPIPFGDSEALQVGEWVLAIGNPFNLSSTVTAGIVSAKGRSTAADGDLKIASFIQTDAAVNSGNSGGALVNTRGELVGINTMIYSQTGSYAGYSFAVPVSIAGKVVADIKQYGTVQRAVLGVVGTNVTSATREEFELKVNEGAVVVEFADASAAKQAGLKEGDVITAVNGVTIRSMAQVQEQIAKHAPGDKVRLDVNRKGKEMSFTVELKNQEGTTAVVEKISANSIGAAFVPLSDEDKAHYGINYGVRVAGVSDGKFRDAGIRKGFIILAINNVRVATSGQVEQIIDEVIKNSPDKVLFIKGMRDNGEIVYTAVDLR